MQALLGAGGGVAEAVGKSGIPYSMVRAPVALAQVVDRRLQQRPGEAPVALLALGVHPRDAVHGEHRGRPRIRRRTPPGGFTTCPCAPSRISTCSWPFGRGVMLTAGEAAGPCQWSTLPARSIRPSGRGGAAPPGAGAGTACGEGLIPVGGAAQSPSRSLACPCSMEKVRLFLKRTGSSMWKRYWECLPV